MPSAFGTSADCITRAPAAAASFSSFGRACLYVSIASRCFFAIATRKGSCASSGVSGGRGTKSPKMTRSGFR
jgi:hypothetical protein